jgi:DNA invertase Pin-like site-specific DNA recombinase
MLAYSYIRFSSKKQASGHSLTRQTELAESYCQRREWTLSKDSYRDLGVSAWRGKNALVGNMGEFLKAVQSKAVKPGSALIVESLDRITRQGIDEGYDLIKKILKAGIILVTLSPEREFDVSATKSLSKGALEIQLILERAAEESERRSERVGKAWREKKRRAANGEAQLATACMGTDARAVTRRLPSWLRWVGGKVLADAEAAQTVKLIFHMAKSGYGLGVITRKLNDDGVPVLGRGKHWARSYVFKILNNRAVVGEYQPYTGRGEKREKDGKPIAGYYPAIIKEAEWYAAQAALTSRRGKVGRLSTRRLNLFTGLLRDARDGGTVNQLNKGKKGRQCVLMSYNAVQGVKGTKAVSFPLGVFEWAILSCLREIKPAEVLPAPRAEVNLTLELSGRKTELDIEIEKIKNRLAVRYSDELADVLERQVEERKALAEELDAAKEVEANPLSEAWGSCKSLLEALETAPDEEEARVRLRAALRRIVEGIWCLFVGRGSVRLAAVQLFLSGGAVRDYLIYHKPATGGSVGVRPARRHVRSLKDIPGGADLRQREDARAYEAELREWDLAEFA